MNTPTTELDGFELMLRERINRLADHAPAIVPAASDVRIIAAGEAPRRRRIAGIGAAIALIAGGAGLSTVAFQGAAEPGGADSPEAAVRDFADALAGQDLLGMIDVTLPEEVSSLRAAFEEVTAEAQRIGLLDDSFALNGVAGLDVTIDRLALTTTSIDADLVAVTSTDGVLGAVFDADAFPLGRLIVDHAAVGIDSGSGTYDLGASQFTLVTVRRGDRWYVSIGMSIADVFRRADGAGPPVSMGIIPEGLANPEQAAESFYRNLSQLDLASALALVAPGEGDVFRRYASLWLPQTQRALSDARADGLSIELSEFELGRIDEADGRVTVRPTRFVIDGTVPAGWSGTGSAGMVMTPEWPTVIYSADGSGVWILEPGVTPPARIDSLGDAVPPESEAVQQIYTNGSFNTTYALYDETIVPFDDVNAGPGEPLPFRIERRDGCTTISGEPFTDFASYSPGSERIDDDTVRTCDARGSFGIGSALFLIVGGGSLENLPPLTLVEDDGQWFVSPIGTIAAQVLEATRSLPDDVNIIDVPVLPILAGAIGRPQLDQIFRNQPDLQDLCQVIAEPDGTGNLRTIADPALADVVACARSLGYYEGTDTSVVTSESGAELAPPSAVEGVTASTTPAKVDAEQPPPTAGPAPATP